MQTDVTLLTCVIGLDAFRILQSASDSICACSLSLNYYDTQEQLICFGFFFSQQPQAVAHSELGGKEQTVNNTGEEPVERGNGNCLQTKTETNRAAADTHTKEHATETDSASGPSRAAAETMAKAGCSSSHYLQQDSAEMSVAIPVKAQRHKPELALTLSTEQCTASLDHAKQESLPLEKETNIREKEAVTGSEPGAESQHNPDHRPASPVIKEINTQDGSMQIIRDHTTRCAVVFQNSALYELD